MHSELYDSLLESGKRTGGTLKPGKSSHLPGRDLNFDFSFVELSIEYLESGDDNVLDKLADSSSVAHLLNHARHTTFETPGAEALVRDLLEPREEKAKLIPHVHKLLSFARREIAGNPDWICETLRYLPEGFCFHGRLYFTFGYDIGVSVTPNASLNLAHSHFLKNPEELVYYAIHELHHTGYTTCHPLPVVKDLRNCSDLLGLVEYCTHLEGMGVYAPIRIRQRNGALDDDPDYVALQSEERIAEYERQYWRDYEYLRYRGTEPLDQDAFTVLGRMSTGDRLWYRVGAHMAATIENELGLPALVEFIKKGPGEFVRAYQRINAAVP